MDWAFLISAMAALFAIIDPLAIVPAYISLTRGIPSKIKLLILRRASLTAVTILLVFGLVGHFIFFFMGFTIDAFRIAGGILLFSVGFSMIYGKKPGTKFHKGSKNEALEQEEIGIVPIGIPLIAGPGAIITMMIYMSETSVGYLERSLVVLIMFFVVFVAYLSMRYADRIFGRVGRMGVRAISRIMGLIIAALAVQFIIDGIMGVAQEYGLL